MEPLRFAIIGTGFWARFQLAAWRELPGVECVALCDRTRSKAEKLAAEFGVPAVYDDPEELLAHERLDFLDVISDVDTHPRFVHLAAERGLPVICQKPMAPTLAQAEGMVRACREAGVPFFVHENWRWQAPLRAAAGALHSGQIGAPFRARLTFVSAFSVFENQPFLAEVQRFILADIGSHILDAARFLFGTAQSLYCETDRIHPHIRGEDVATVMLRMRRDTGRPTTVICEMGYPGNPTERDCFPETLLFIEGERGSIELAAGYRLRVTTSEGTISRRVCPPRYAWADPAYDLVQASIVPCNADLLAALRGERPAETTGEDNLRTARLVDAAYESADTGRALRFDTDGRIVPG